VGGGGSNSSGSASKNAKSARRRRSSGEGPRCLLAQALPSTFSQPPTFSPWDCWACRKRLITSSTLADLASPSTLAHMCKLSSAQRLRTSSRRAPTLAHLVPTRRLPPWLALAVCCAGGVWCSILCALADQPKPQTLLCALG
jgi:hypothetical protein